jgi:hypothetical protein
MGVSTDAILFWGAHHEEDEEWPFEDYDPEEFLLEKLGLCSPAEEYDPESPYIKKKYESFWANSRETLEDFGVGFDTHCSGDYPIPYVYVSESRTLASRGYPASITSLEVKPEWEAKLRRFYDLVGKPYPENVGWWLVSYWG